MRLCACGEILCSAGVHTVVVNIKLAFRIRKMMAQRRAIHGLQPRVFTTYHV